MDLFQHAVAVMRSRSHKTANQNMFGVVVVVEVVIVGVVMDMDLFFFDSIKMR